MSDPPTHGVGIAVSTPEPINEKAVTVLGKDEDASGKELFAEDARDSADAVIVTGADVAAHLLPMRDDFDPTLTFRAAILGSGLAAFLAVMTQIYAVSESAHLIYYPRTANRCIPSSNRPKWTFQAFSSFLFLTSSVLPGLNFSPEVIGLRRDGENKMGRSGFLGGSLLLSL